MITTTIILVLAGLGAGALAALIVKFVFLAAKWLFSKIKNYLRERAARKVFVAQINGMVQQMKEDAEKNQNTVDIDDILGDLNTEENLIEVRIEPDGEITEENITIYKNDKLDPKIKQKLQQGNGQLLITGTAA